MKKANYNVPELTIVKPCAVDVISASETDLFFMEDLENGWDE